jgi:adenylate cyclase
MMSESLLVWMLAILLFLVVLGGASLWLLWQLKGTSASSAAALTEQGNASAEIRNSLSKVMLHTQRTTSLLESSAKDTSSHIDGISLEVRQSVSMLSDALVELQQSLPATLRGDLEQQWQIQSEKQQSLLQSGLQQFLGTEIQTQIQGEFREQFQSSFDSLQIALPDLLREDFTNIFGTELDLIQKQVDTALEALSNAQGGGSSSSLLPQEYDDVKQMLAAMQEHLEELRQNQSDTINRQGEIQFALRELSNTFVALETFMQEVTDIPRMTEVNLRKPLQELQNLIKGQVTTIETTLPELISTQTAKVTRKLAAHSSSEDIAKLGNAFESLLERRQKKETLLKTMSELQTTIGQAQPVLPEVPKEEPNNEKDHVRLTDDLQRLQNRLLEYEERSTGTSPEKAAQREISVLESLTAESVDIVSEVESETKKPRLLIVDDSTTNLSILKTILHREMFDLTLVGDGNAALDAVADEPPDIVLLDIILPDIDGYEVCKEIKSIPETQDIPVIFMSGINDTQAIVKGFEVGGADYVIKPFQQAEIIARLKFHYELYKIRRTQHLYITQIQHEREKSDHLLKSILPEAIAERLKKGEGSIADGLPNVSVLFADIVGFTNLSARVSPQELVEMLNVVFSAFDTLTQNHGLEKIKTIGDAYMVAGGLLNSRPDHLAAMARLGLEMTDEIKRCADFLGADLNIRIGLNCGEATAGVIGQNKFAYDLWGDTVNTASRMESHGEPGRVHCSAAVYEALKDEFAFEDRGEMEVKGKGRMKTYFIEQVRKAE